MPVVLDQTWCRGSAAQTDGTEVELHLNSRQLAIQPLKRNNENGRESAINARFRKTPPMRAFNRRGPLFAAIAALFGSACVKPPAAVPGTIAENTIDITHVLPADFALSASITSLMLMIDEADGGAPLYTSRVSATTGRTGDGRAFSLEVDDFDFDSRFEALLTFSGNPFDGGQSWLLSLEGSPDLPPFLVRAALFRADGGGSEAFAGAMATGFGGTTRFGGGRHQLTLAYDCFPGIACRADAGLDAGTPDAGPDSDASAPTSRLLLVPTGIPAAATQLVAVIDQGLLGGTTTVELPLANDAGTAVDLPKTSNYRVRAIATRSYSVGTRSVIGGAAQSGISLADGGQVVVPLAFAVPTATNTSPRECIAWHHPNAHPCRIRSRDPHDRWTTHVRLRVRTLLKRLGHAPLAARVRRVTLRRTIGVNACRRRYRLLPNRARVALPVCRRRWRRSDAPPSQRRSRRAPLRNRRHIAVNWHPRSNDFDTHGNDARHRSRCRTAREQPNRSSGFRRIRHRHRIEPRRRIRRQRNRRRIVRWNGATLRGRIGIRYHPRRRNLGFG